MWSLCPLYRGKNPRDTVKDDDVSHDFYKLCEGTSKDLIEATCAGEEEKRAVETIFKYWQKMALTSLRTAMPGVVWQNIAIDDWEQAMKILSNIEKGVENEN